MHNSKKRFQERRCQQFMIFENALRKIFLLAGCIKYAYIS